MADPNVIPFAEGAPADDLMVETLPDGDVLIGDPELDVIEESDSGFRRKSCRRDRRTGAIGKRRRACIVLRKR
jgi:hypothetical protein